jgi:hypothetical protein
MIKFKSALMKQPGTKLDWQQQNILQRIEGRIFYL